MYAAAGQFASTVLSTSDGHAIEGIYQIGMERRIQDHAASRRRQCPDQRPRWFHSLNLGHFFFTSTLKGRQVLKMAPLRQFD